MSFFCDRLPMLLTIVFIACSTSHSAIGAQDARPDDFRAEYEWRAGSLPPFYHYEYTITITPSGQSKMVLTPDYTFLDPSAVVPTWAEPFHVEEPNLHDLYRVMVENELFTRSWRKRDTPLVPRSSYQTLVVIARGKHITVEDFLVSEQEASANVMYAAVRALVPKNLWEQLEARREQYIEKYPRR